jgi:hypothetical protein
MRTLKKSVAWMAALLCVLLGFAPPSWAPTEKQLPPAEDMDKAVIFAAFDKVVELADYDRSIKFLSKDQDERDAIIRGIIDEVGAASGLDHGSTLLLTGPYLKGYLMEKGMCANESEATLRLTAHITLGHYWDEYNAEFRRVTAARYAKTDSRV